MEKYHYHDVDRRGTVQRVDYSTTDRNGRTVAKYANVYLPYGYDPSDLETRYDILYVMHGGGGNADAFLDCAPFKNMLDYSIAENRIRPLIVVFPSYYKELKRELRIPGSFDEREETLFFQQELVQDLIPAVEGRYHTHALHVTPEGIRSSRLHRGFSGFSMGGCTTWYALLNNLDSIAWFAPLSGDCWELDIKGGLTRSEETAKVLHDRILASGYGKKDFFIYAATGTKDIAFEPLSAQIEAMRHYPDLFAEGEDDASGNFHYLVAEGEYHSYEAVYQYLYLYLPFLFTR